MSSAEIAKKVQDVVERISKKQVSADMHLIDERVIDSVSLLEVIMELEEVFSITIDPFDMDPQRFSSITAITSFVEAKI